MEGDLSNWRGLTARRTAPSRPLERPGWRGFVPRRREPVLCSAMGKDLAGTLMSGERGRGREDGPPLSCLADEEDGTRGPPPHGTGEQEERVAKTAETKQKKEKEKIIAGFKLQICAKH